MGGEKLRDSSAAIWGLVRSQHGVVSRRQLLEAGLSPKAIEHRIRRGRLFPLWRGVYAVGRREVGQLGVWRAALLACGPEALLGHGSAAALLGLIRRGGGPIRVVVPGHVARRRRGVRLHRQARIDPADREERAGIAVTGPAATLLALAADGDPRLEEAVASADRLGQIDADALRLDLRYRHHHRGATRLRALLDRDTYARTDSVLERWFLRIVAEAGLPRPLTQVELNGYRVDFYWPRFRLVVETDGLRYHRTAAQQARDLRREQAHLAAGLRALRFAASQLRHEPGAVRATLLATMDHAVAEDSHPR